MRPGICERCDSQGGIVSKSAVTEIFLCVLCLLSGCGGGSPGQVTSQHSQPTIRLSASSSTVAVGQSLTLIWSSSGASACTASANPAESDWSGSRPTGGTASVTPTSAGTITYTLQCSGSGGSASQSASVTGNVGQLTIISAPPAGVLGVQYGGSGFLLMASGGTAPYSWGWSAAVGSSLPPGLNLASGTGVISGIPTTVGSYSVVLTVADSRSPAAHATVNHTITISAAATLTITSGASPNGVVGIRYGGSHIIQGHQIWGFILSATGGVGTYSWGWTPASGSSLPPGLTVKVLFFGGSTRCCLYVPVISGTP